MRFRTLVPYVVFLAILVMAVKPSADTDTWWHLRSGETILVRQEILRRDPFSLTQFGEPWIYPGWLAQISLFTIFDEFSFGGLNIFTGVMVLVAFLLIWPVLEGHDLVRAFILMLAVATSGIYWSARPQIVSFALTGAWVFMLEMARRGRYKVLWVMPLLMILWVNVHGGFAVGFLLFGLYLIGELFDVIWPTLSKSESISETWSKHRDFIRYLLLAGLGCLIAACLNPHGPIILLYPLRTISIGALRDHIQEWQSPDFHLPKFQPFLLMLLLIFLAFIFSRKRRTATDILLISVFGYMSFMAARNIALFALITAPILARHSQSWLEPYLDQFVDKRDLPERITRPINLLIAILLAIVGLVRILTQLPDEINQDHVRDLIPLDAFSYLEERPPQRHLFNTYNWGGYVLWDLHPEYLSFVDGRTDLFGDEILDMYLSTWLAEPGWHQVIEDWDIQVALLEPSAPLAQAMKGEGWNVEYQDHQALVLMNPDQAP